jgi:hypothetical protein
MLVVDAAVLPIGPIRAKLPPSAICIQLADY